MCSNTFLNHKTYIFAAMKKYTIKNIAELAGVSKGTVDRVIHKRGKVSAKALKKVNAILNEIDYKPNLLARSLKNTKNYQICVIMPDYKKDPFWVPCYKGVLEAISEFSAFGIFINPYFFDPTEVKSFIEINTIVLNRSPDAVLIAPLFYKETVKIVNAYKASNIIVSKFNNPLEIENTENFVGQDLFKSGRVAGNLLNSITQKNSTIAIIHIDEDLDNALYIQEKERGFRSYFDGKEKSNYKIATHSLKQHRLKEELETIINSNSKVNAVFVTTSKIYKVAEYIKQKKLQEIKLVGYDLLSENIEFLNDDVINFLIHQNPKKQVSLGIKFLVDFFLFNKKIPSKSLLPIDIITSENLNSYLN